MSKADWEKGKQAKDSAYWRQIISKNTYNLLLNKTEISIGSNKYCSKPLSIIAPNRNKEDSMLVHYIS